MKIITSIEDIKNLVKNDQYIIQPVDFDLQIPEKLINFQKEIDNIQKLIEEKFTTVEVETKELSFKTEDVLNQMTEKELVEYGLIIGADVNIKYSKAENLKNVKLIQITKK